MPHDKGKHQSIDHMKTGIKKRITITNMSAAALGLIPCRVYIFYPSPGLELGGTKEQNLNCWFLFQIYLN